MESNGIEDYGGYKKSRWITKPNLVISTFSLLASLVGGFVLGWWLHKYHPKNKQLWMVPFGFVLFLTPLIVCLSIIVPDMCISSKSHEEEALKMSQLAGPVMTSPISDPKK